MIIHLVKDGIPSTIVLKASTSTEITALSGVYNTINNNSTSDLFEFYYDDTNYLIRKDEVFYIENNAIEEE
jgi:hypothetical protein